MRMKLVVGLLVVVEVLVCVDILVIAKPPENPVQCSNGTQNCTIKSTYGIWADRKECLASSAAFPSTESGLVAAVAQAVRLRKKLKVISPWAHSMPKLACPDGDDGFIISMSRYNRRIVVDKSRNTAEVDAGIDLSQLVDAIAQHGLALPYMPYWGGVSIGGLISTGAHGSSLFQKGGAVHEYVVALRLVIPATKAEGYARVVVLDESQPEEFNAAKVGLGVLGAISTVSLYIKASFFFSPKHIRVKKHKMFFMFSWIFVSLALYMYCLFIGYFAVGATVQAFDYEREGIGRRHRRSDRRVRIDP